MNIIRLQKNNLMSNLHNFKSIKNVSVIVGKIIIHIYF